MSRRGALLVVDVSTLVDVLSDAGDRGTRARDTVRSRRWAAPETLVVETAHALRRLARGSAVAASAADVAVAQLASLEYQVVPTRLLVDRIWALRGSLNAYDAAYVATAERVGGVLVTGDARLARAPGLSCEVVAY